MSQDPQLTSNTLLEANPASLEELFSRDPLHLQDQDITRIVEELRRKRANWAKSEAEGKKPKSTKAEIKAKDADAFLAGLDL